MEQFTPCWKPYAEHSGLCTLVQRYQYQEVSSLGPQDKPGVVVLDKSTLPVQKILPLGTGHLLLVNLESKIDFLTALSGNSKSRARRELCGGIILKNLSIRSNILSITGDFNCILSPKDCMDNLQAKFKSSIWT